METSGNNGQTVEHGNNDNNIDETKRIDLSKHVGGDGVHLNDSGTAVLKYILLDALNSIYVS